MNYIFYSILCLSNIQIFFLLGCLNSVTALVGWCKGHTIFVACWNTSTSSVLFTQVVCQRGDHLLSSDSDIFSMFSPHPSVWCTQILECVRLQSTAFSYFLFDHAYQCALVYVSVLYCGNFLHFLLKKNFRYPSSQVIVVKEMQLLQMLTILWIHCCCLLLLLF